MTVAFKRLRPGAALPAYAHESDAGMDLRSADEAIGGSDAARTG